MKKLILLFIALTTFACAKKSETQPKQNNETTTSVESKEYMYQPETTKLTWTAFKTPEKIGVSGTFKEITVIDTHSSNNKEEVLEGAKFTISGLSVFSEDSDRDSKLSDLFFKNLTTSEITGQIGNFENGIVTITIQMNGKEVTKDFSYEIQENELIIKGSIDILKDFDAKKSFDSLHEACKELHAGKTWSEVNIEISTQL